METLLRKQRSKYTNPEGSNVAVSGLWFTVSGKIWKIEPIPEQTLKIICLLGHIISLTFDLIKVILEVALSQDYREVFFFLKKTYQKKGFLLNLHPNRRNLSIDEPTSLNFSCLKRPSTHMQDALENVFAQREIIFTHRLTLDESNSCPSRPTVLYV